MPKQIAGYTLLPTCQYNALSNIAIKTEGLQHENEDLKQALTDATGTAETIYRVKQCLEILCYLVIFVALVLVIRKNIL
jgi:hypothetical protein